MTTIGRKHAVLLTALLLVAGLRPTAVRVARSAAPTDDRPRPAAEATAVRFPHVRELPQGPPAIDMDALVVLRGRVVAPDNRPVAGARLYLSAQSSGGPVELGTTDADGAYRFETPERLFHDFEDDTIRQQVRAALIAVADGFGPAWTLLEGVDRDGWMVMQPEYEQDLRLLDDLPIDGRIVDASGQPVAGASIAVTGIFQLSDPLWAPMVKAIEAGDPSALDRKESYPNGWRQELRRTAWQMMTPAVTDADGRFHISGLGQERVIEMLVRGPGIRSINFSAVTRDDVTEFTRAIRTRFPRRPEPDGYFYPPRNDRPAADDGVQLYDPRPTIEVDPARTVSGVVRDARTGAPIPGIYMVANDRSSHTDRHGRYHIVRGDDATTLRVSALVHRLETHLSAVRFLEGAGHLGETVVDFELSPGVKVSGRVLEAGTAQPIVAGRKHTCHCPWPGVMRAGFVQYFPLSNNAPLLDTPEGMYLADVPRRASNYYCSAVIDDDGNFYLAVPPGPGVLLAVSAPGRPDFAETGVWQESIGMHRLFPYLKLTARAPADGAPGLDPSAFPGFNGPIRIGEYHAYRVIDPAADAASMEVTLEVARAPSRLLQFVESDGRPVAQDLLVGGLAPATNLGGMRVVVSDGDAEAVALEWGKPREITAVTADGELVARASLDVLDPQPKVVQLERAATISGRLVDAATGNPLGDYFVRFRYDPHVGYRHESLKTEADGRFTIRGLLPGLRASMTFQEPRAQAAGFAAQPVIHQPEGMENLLLAAGEALEVGDVAITPSAPAEAAAAPGDL